MQILSQETLTQIICSASMGVWIVELFDGEHPRMQASDKMLELLGLNTSASLSAEEVYDAWFSRIHPDAVSSVKESLSKMMSGQRDENTYCWNHPVLGTRYVRCGGTATRITGKGFRIQGYHYDVTDQKLHEEESNLIFSSLAESYMCLYYLDLHKGSYVSYNNSVPFVKDIIPETGWISVGLDNFVKKLCKPESEKQLRVPTRAILMK